MQDESALYQQVREILDGARNRVARSINVEMTRAYESAKMIIPSSLSEWSASPEHAKNPFVLEFLGLPDRAESENDLEEALLSHLQNFLLELGKGFSFVARQKRITVDGNHFYVDLVFYNRLLRCFVLIDLKMDKLTHGDLGQMQFYTNCYTREIREDYENPAIGILLCADKNEAVVRYTLPENQSQIFAARFALQMPTEAELKAEIERETARLQSAD